MMTVLSCIGTKHDPLLFGVAALICILGSIITTQLYARGRRTISLQRMSWLFMAGIIGGSTIWTTHFVAMMSYEPTVRHAFAADLTLVSLVMAITATLLGMVVSTLTTKGPAIELGGLIIGLGIALMHFTGMAAYEVEGQKVWDLGMATASILLGATFGILMCNRIARPIWRFCRHGGTAALILAIVTMHFTAMTALTIVPDPTVAVSSSFVPDDFMAVLVSAITIIIISFGTAAYFIDMQTQRNTAERFRHLALHDAVTGLPNRSSLVDYIDSVITRDDEAGQFTLIKIGLSELKHVSERHGFSAADALLRTAAQRLRLALDSDTFLARGTADALVVCVSRHTKTEAQRLAHHLVKVLNETMMWDGTHLAMGAHAGLATLSRAPGRDSQQLLTEATMALDRAKEAGAGAVRVYDRAIDDLTRAHVEMTMALQTGIERNEFFLVYQAQNDVESRAVVGYEALVRWRHAERGLIPPSEFIPLAESTGFIHRLGDWVLKTAALEAAGWARPLSIAVNVAPAQLADIAFPLRVQQILNETGLDARRLELEITESGIIADQQKALAIIQQLKQLGVRIAMDDYGTGYSSLSMLQSFPFDKIKIDRSFVDAVAVSRPSAAIVRSTIILSHSLDIPVLAEGVETEEQMDFLRQEGCLCVQGYLFGKPQTAEQIAAVTGMAVSASAA
ncbi:hypothetical protein BJF92_06695 [Rhizobium rhizosphaerae]|uniref:Uncharacterized protein n=1 Tax=Xaviernesmea rhizosphaerae TaxID=1672749 RepID=A0A1Q9AP51_9HYPH|nr:EAL domain-containing protein [Xaviernesmea rhizosphaerae]OLP57207.1 hypothetical protein BJF92_06695 [Xaviernesmea rhizosphaerae]